MVCLSTVIIIIGLIYQVSGQTTPTFIGEDGNLFKTFKEGVFEGTPVGTVLGQVRAQVLGNPNAVLKYEVSSLYVEIKNTSTGVVTLARDLDREKATDTGNDYQVTWTVSYVWNGQTIFINDVVTLSINDINDNVPQFLLKPYNADIPEDTPVGTKVFSGIKMFDADIGIHAELQLICLVVPNDKQTRDACDFFHVNSTQVFSGNYTGAIYLKKPLNFEDERSFTMTLQVEDDPQHQGNISFKSDVNVALTVIDNQDTLPFFVGTPITIFVIENLALNRSVHNITARDGDTGSPRPIKIVNKDPNQLFRVGDSVQVGENAWQSSVFINQPIDREKLQARYQFVVEAIELENGVETDQRANTTITVNIQDMDDNIPTFEYPTYTVNVTEIDSQNTGTTTLPGLSMKVTDPDDASFARFNVGIKSATPHDNFLVSPDNGVGSALISLTIKSPALMNYEVLTDRVQTVEVVASDVSNSSRSSVATVTIYLIDANDNYPKFLLPKYSLSANENLVINGTIGTVTASDADSGLNAELRYSLSGTGADVFRVDPVTGTISLAKPLDYETSPKYELLYIAKDQGVSPRETSVSLSINVIDINDFGPVFNPADYRTSIRETEMTLLIPVTVMATDQESGTNITYRIVAGNTADNAFVLGLRTGVLSLTRKISYEETPDRRGYFELIVEATDSDQPPQKTNTTITVTIVDENTNNPIFDSSSYTGNISELAPVGTLVTTVRATDKDLGSNGNIQYYIFSGGQDMFEINANNGELRVGARSNLDYDKRKMFNIVVNARDEGSPPLTGNVDVIVFITDSNNKLPVFNKDVYTVNVDESVGVGTQVLRVNATDQDSTSQLQYSIPRSSIVARDNNGVAIQQVYPFDYREAFIIDPMSGIISTNLTLSVASAASIEFNAMVTDTKAEIPQLQTATAAVLITILANASVEPTFAAPWTVASPFYNFRIAEETNITTMITTLIAYDPALQQNIRNFEEIANSDIGNYFSVDRPTGQIRINRRLDYETLNFKFLTFGVRAIGTKATSTASVTIQVTDINDNVPQFRNSPYRFSIDEDRRFPTQVGAVYATDLDSGSYANIRFTLSGQGENHFFIYTSSNQEGLIFIRENVTLDYETDKVYNLILTATDNYESDVAAEVQQVNTTNLIINVVDTNDNAPNFTSGNYSFFTVESYDVGTVIDRVQAEDKDGGLFGEIVYSLEPLDDPNDIRKFFLHPDTGEFKSTASLQGLSIRSPIHFKVTAMDSGSPPKFGVAYIQLNITSGQLASGLPIWTRPAPGTMVDVTEEITPAGTLIYTCLAGAATPGASIHYSFVFSSDALLESMFAINSTTCEITLKRVPDREFRESDTYDLLIIAQDTLNATLKSSRKLTIRLVDINDEHPSFEDCPDRQYGKPEVATVREEAPIGTHIYTVRACDKDSNPLYTQIKYRFVTAIGQNFTQCYNTPGVYFNLHETTGKLTISKPIDRELTWPSTLDYFLLCIKADQYDPAGRKKRNIPEYDFSRVTSDQYLFLLVTVIDINDQTPYFPFTGVKTSAVLKYPTEDVVLQVTATDRDSDLYNKIRYSVMSSIFPSLGRNLPIDGAFNINPDSGEVRVGMAAYTSFTDGHFILNIKAEDIADTTKTSTAQIKIYVSDDSSQVRLVGRTENLPDPTTTANNLLRDMGSRGNVDLHQTKIKYHTTLSGATVHARTDICFVVIKNGKVLDSQQGISEISSSLYSDILTNYAVGDPGACEAPTRKTSYDAYWWVLVAFAIFMFLWIVVLIIVISVLYRNYRQYMKTRKTYLIQE